MINVSAYKDRAWIPGIGDVEFDSLDALRDQGTPKLAEHLAERRFIGVLRVRGPRGATATFWVPEHPGFGPILAYGSRAIERRLLPMWRMIRRENPAPVSYSWGSGW